MGSVTVLGAALGAAFCFLVLAVSAEVTALLLCLAYLYLLYLALAFGQALAVGVEVVSLGGLTCADIDLGTLFDLCCRAAT